MPNPPTSTPNPDDEESSGVGGSEGAAGLRAVPCLYGAGFQGSAIRSCVISWSWRGSVTRGAWDKGNGEWGRGRGGGGGGFY